MLNLIAIILQMIEDTYK